MSAPSDEGRQVPYRCPLCSAKLAPHQLIPSLAMPCSDCGYFLWCRSRIVDEVVVLDVQPETTPEQKDVERLGESLVAARDVPRVVVNLSNLDYVSSLLMAKLLVLNRRLQGTGGALILCAMQPYVRQAFCSTKLDTLFEIADDEGTALADLVSGNPA